MTNQNAQKVEFEIDQEVAQLLAMAKMKTLEAGAKHTTDGAIFVGALFGFGLSLGLVDFDPETGLPHVITDATRH